ncbi:hypothetical protein WR25_23433 [Diploscapter pachys]|uniref:DEAD/DEAH-box helicase domain-containing protein n=1 Tax=Diploscapter pachys TaxID=2018661 RepID=A0A2A2JM70_9BILA|nr:hypothetical protein WR25_23433 [Diploscapter pachys]
MQIEGCLSQLPPEIPQRYREIGVSALYSWQTSLLLDLKQSDRNYLITTPPNTGKSLVADLLAFHYVSQPRKVCIVHSSFTLAKSRFRFLEPLWFKSGKKLVGFFEHHLRPLDDDWDGTVLVIEQMNLLFNEMVANRSLSKIGLIIIHEFHSFYDRSKGAEYECFLTKLKFYNSRNPQNQVRIVCFGNYVPKSKELVEWLDAELYLMETYKKNIHRWVYFRDENSVYNMKTQRVARYLDKLPPDPQGGVIRLALESINSGGQVIIYTASNHEANKMAKLFTTEFANLHSTKKSQYSAELEKRMEALRELRDSCARRLLKWDRMLVKTMAYGIGVYHTGLTQIERDVVEKAFRDDSLILLITTNQSSNLKLASARVLIVPSMTGENAITRHTLLQIGARCTKVVDEQYAALPAPASPVCVARYQPRFAFASSGPLLDRSFPISLV